MGEAEVAVTVFRTPDDGELFQALLTIVYYGDVHSVRLEHHGSHASRDVICIGDKVYGTDDPVDRRVLVEYAMRLRRSEANVPREPLPSPN